MNDLSYAGKALIVILYTTKYREGGKQFAQAALTLAQQKRKEFPNHPVLCQAIESKKEFARVFEKINSADSNVEEFHFIGHSGVYGIMFGTRQWPEQFSPFEWKQLKIPFTKNGKCFFHSCRSGRWFAPFISRTFQVKTFGYHWYTTVSRSKNRFIWEKIFNTETAPLYVISCPGKKSHGWSGSFSKHLGLARSFPMMEFCPTQDRIDTTYDSVAELYDNTFEDIGVREDELRWLVNQLGDVSESRILDIGCGNGAFLSKLASGIQEGVGVDISEKMLEQARKRNAAQPHLTFQKIDGPVLPFADQTFDKVISVLSFRYLDWDPILKEILRVLKPGGEFLVVDMVAAPVTFKEVPFLLRSKMKAYYQRSRYRNYFNALHKMVNDVRWKNMLKYNPIRSEHEMRWYLESRFQGKKAELINMGWNSRILAFRSGPITEKNVAEMTYP